MLFQLRSVEERRDSKCSQIENPLRSQVDPTSVSSGIHTHSQVTTAKRRKPAHHDPRPGYPKNLSVDLDKYFL